MQIGSSDNCNINFIEKKYKSKVAQYSFRYKEAGWRGYNVYVAFKDGRSTLNTPDVFSYANIFCSGLALRPACYNCKYCNLTRPSDITIADFWGIEKRMPDFDDNKGISLVLVNSSKGLKLFEEISGSLYHRESNTRDCLQHNLHSPTQMRSLREQFWRDYWDKGFDCVLKKYAGCGLTGRIKRSVRLGLEILGLMPIVKNLLSRA